MDNVIFSYCSSGVDVVVSLLIEKKKIMYICIKHAHAQKSTVVLDFWTKDQPDEDRFDEMRERTGRRSCMTILTI